MRFLLAFPLLLAACDVPTTPESPTRAAPPSAALCAETLKALDVLKAKGAIDYDAKGEATIPQDAWMRMGAGEHSQFARLLAFHAACESPDGSAERPVRIRNETGTILLENMVPTTVDFGAAD